MRRLWPFLAEHKRDVFIALAASVVGQVAHQLEEDLEILPRVTRYSGLEWGSGMHRNPVSPEEAAEVLRG